MGESDNSKVSNNIVYNITNVTTNADSYAAGIYSGISGTTQYVHNNTIYNIQNTASTGAAYGIYDSGGSTIVAKNNYVGLVDSTNGFEACFNGTFSTEDYNVASDTSTTGANSITSMAGWLRTASRRERMISAPE